MFLHYVSAQTDRNTGGRRIVTGIDNEGKSIIVSDGFVPENARYGETKTLNGNVLWVESQVPVDVGEKSESLEGYTFSLEPPEGGFTVHLLTLEPGFNGGNHQTKTIDLVFIQRAKPFSVGDNHQATSRFYIP